MGVFDFATRLGIGVNAGELKNDYIVQFSHHLFDVIDQQIGWYYERGTIFDDICLCLSLQPSEVIALYNRQKVFVNDPDSRPSINSLINHDFHNTLKVIEKVYSRFPSYKKTIDNINKVQIEILSRLGLAWRKGRYFLVGDQTLDVHLIKETIEMIRENIKSSTLYKNALNNYSLSLNDPVKRKDAIINAYQAVEELSKKIVGEKYFDRHFEELVTKLKLNDYWKNILHYYRELSKEFGRHSGRDEFIPEQEDTEAFLYLSGLLLRLISQKVEK
ncbi:MAG: hypothetical protein V1907_02855 [Candidatus Kerfeldbacteria bacterium]